MQACVRETMAALKSHTTAGLDLFLLPDDSSAVQAWLGSHTRSSASQAASWSSWSSKHDQFRKEQALRPRLEEEMPPLIQKASLDKFDHLTPREKDSLHTHLQLALRDGQLKPGVLEPGFNTGPKVQTL